MQTFLQVSGLKPSFDVLYMMEEQFLKLVSKQDEMKMPIQIIGDLNYTHSNIYLSCASSPLTGALAWYKCSREGVERTPMHWKIMQGPWGLLSIPSVAK